METKRGITPIKEKILQPNFLLVLEFSEGFIFSRVVRRRICGYKPWPLINAAGDIMDIPASSHQAELRFRDPRSPEDDILFLDTSTNAGFPWLLHGSIGIKPSQISMYPRFPEGKEIPGRFPNIDPVRPSGGDDFGYVDSLRSPYEEPTDFVEYVIPPGTRLAAEYYNHDSERAHQPVMNLFFAVYWFQTLTKEEHGRLISDIAARRIPATFLTVGFGDVPHELGGTLARDWDVRPMSLDEALEGGR